MTLGLLLGLGCWLVIVGVIWTSPLLIILGFGAWLLGFGLAGVPR